MNRATCWKSRSYVLSKLSARSARFLSTTALLCLTGTGVIAAQTQNQWHDAESIAAKSRAEQAAELQVALSPEKIIELLRQEPGLLLQVKKMLVRKAYEQGRILDPEDLTDDALFQLLHEDHNVCVLATREIEDRSYVRAKPTVQEVERQHERDARAGVTRTVASAEQKSEGAAQKLSSQEDFYWDKHDGSVEPYRIGQPQSQPQQTQPATPAVPRNPPAGNSPQRQVEMTGLPQNSDSYDGMGMDPGTPLSDSG